jgi:hypothetical protein
VDVTVDLDARPGAELVRALERIAAAVRRRA